MSSFVITMIKKINEYPKLMLLCLFVFAGLYSCQPDKFKVDVSEIKVDAKIMRLDRDILDVNKQDPEAAFSLLQKKYGGFFDIYLRYIISVGETGQPGTIQRLRQFLNDPGVQDLFRETQTKFTSLDDLEAELESALKHYAHYFPEKVVPKPVAFVSGLNYAIITTDSSLGIGLDMYLGPDFKAYESIGLPRYKINKMKPEYIAVDCIRGMAQSEWAQDTVPREFLSQMVYQGKMYYFMKSLLPEKKDEDIIQFSKQQLDWCTENENRIWAFFIENNLIYSTDAIEFLKFINDGPSTNGFPAEAPPMLGSWVGWQIVRAYMKNSPEVSLEGLMAETDVQKILRVSKYKPRK